jgi:hypothetical protein
MQERKIVSVCYTLSSKHCSAEQHVMENQMKYYIASAKLGWTIIKDNMYSTNWKLVKFNITGYCLNTADLLHHVPIFRMFLCYSVSKAG